LRAVRAWLDPAVPYVVTGPADWDEEVKRQQGLLSEQLVGWREKYPDCVSNRSSSRIGPRMRWRRTPATRSWWSSGRAAAVA